MNKGPGTPTQRPAHGRKGGHQTSCPHCNKPIQRPHRSRKQEFSPLERIGITINNKLGRAINSQTRGPVVDVNDLDCGDHICIERYQPMTYTHHGLYLGFGMVIHYDFHEITIVSLDEFAKGQKIYRIHSPVSYPPEMVMARAATRVGEKNYNIMTNNCEHFVRWCRNGKEININPDAEALEPKPTKKSGSHSKRRPL